MYYGTYYICYIEVLIIVTAQKKYLNDQNVQKVFKFHSHLIKTIIIIVHVIYY